MTFICCPFAKSPPRRLRKKLQCGPKSTRSNGNVVHDISPGILTDDHRDDLVPSLFEEIFVKREEEQTDGRHGGARKKRRFVEVATGRNGLRRKIHPRLPKNVRAINSCRNPAVSLAGSVPAAGMRRASRQTSFKCALKFHQLATSRKPSRRLYPGLGSCCSRRIWPGKVPGRISPPRWDLPVDPTFRPSSCGLRVPNPDIQI
ncbi:unnamed protein product [Lasius platythorax]|uniref:Uncharacterized protein n=1 Tax=Lasius platythorax TaxID=488582 RepID=A0AAV2NIP6_9HYME